MISSTRVIRMESSGSEEPWPAAEEAMVDDGRITTPSVEAAIQQSTPKRRAPKLRKGSKRARRPLLSIDQILEWADAWHARHNAWPNVLSGPIEEAPGETWVGINTALTIGVRGLPGGSSLALLFEHERGH